MKITKPNTTSAIDTEPKSPSRALFRASHLYFVFVISIDICCVHTTMYIPRGGLCVWWQSPMPNCALRESLASNEVRVKPVIGSDASATGFHYTFLALDWLLVHTRLACNIARGMRLTMISAWVSICKLFWKQMTNLVSSKLRSLCQNGEL